MSSSLESTAEIGEGRPVGLSVTAATKGACGDAVDDTGEVAPDGGVDGSDWTEGDGAAVAAFDGVGEDGGVDDASDADDAEENGGSVEEAGAGLGCVFGSYVSAPGYAGGVDKGEDDSPEEGGAGDSAGETKAGQGGESGSFWEQSSELDGPVDVTAADGSVDGAMGSSEDGGVDGRQFDWRFSTENENIGNTKCACATGWSSGGSFSCSSFSKGCASGVRSV